MKIVLVTGGRAYPDLDKVFRVLDEEQPDLVIHGGAKTPSLANRDEYLGADYFASVWCDQHDVPQLKAPYLRKHGRAGGPIRNSWEIGFLKTVLHYVPHWTGKVVAFPGDTGTADTVKKARSAGFVLREIA